MGTIKGNYKWKGVAINEDIVVGIAKAGQVIWKLSRIFAGVLSAMPSTGEEIRDNISSFDEGDIFTVVSNGVDKNYIVAVPEGKTLLRIVTSNNETLYESSNQEESNFKLSTSITSIPDNAGVYKNYQVYTFYTILPFNAGVILTITTV